jgi:hypothetical protein
MLGDLLAQKSVNNKPVTDTGAREPVDSENIKLKIGYGSYLDQHLKPQPS